MNLFLTAPVNNIRLYAAKCVEIFAETTFMFFVFTIPSAIAYYLALDLSLKFLAAGLIVSLPFLLIPVGIGVSFATLFAKLIAHIWRRGFVLVVAIILTFSWVLYRLMLAVSAAQIEKSGARTIIAASGIYGSPVPYWFPSRWASDLLVSFLGAGVELAGIKLALLFAAAVVSFALGYLVFDFFSLPVRSTAQVSDNTLARRATNCARRDLTRTLVERLVAFAPVDVQMKAIILKDLSSLVRDRAQAIQLLLYLGIAAVYVAIFGFMGAAFRLAPVALQVWLAVLSSINVLFAGFILSSVMTRLVYPSVSLEGRAFWVLQVTPIEIEKLIRAKFFCWLPLTMFILVSLLLCGAFGIGLGNGAKLFAAATGVALSIGCTGLAIGLGAMFASFNWESPSQIAVGFGTLFLLLLNVAFVSFCALPAAIVNFLVIIPRLQELLGAPSALAVMVLCVFTLFFANLWLAQAACQRGARVLVTRKLSELV